ncbi:MAG: cupin domain-containing protein [Acidimicrobiales bacterium]
MAPSGPNPISVDDTVARLRFLPDRTPTTTAEAFDGVFARLADYRDGGIFVGRWAGSSEWERHTAGDEIVLVMEGATTIFFLTADGEQPAALSGGQLVIVPQGTWHRFDTPESVLVMSVTPQPTDHSVERP